MPISIVANNSAEEEPNLSACDKSLVINHLGEGAVGGGVEKASVSALLTRAGRRRRRRARRKLLAEILFPSLLVLPITCQRCIRRCLGQEENSPQKTGASSVSPRSCGAPPWLSLRSAAASKAGSLPSPPTPLSPFGAFTPLAGAEEG